MRHYTTHIRSPWYLSFLAMACGQDLNPVDTQPPNAECGVVADDGLAQPRLPVVRADDPTRHDDVPPAQDVPAVVESEPTTQASADGNLSISHMPENMADDTSDDTADDHDDALSDYPGQAGSASFEELLADNPITTYAPFVYLHHSEKNLPMAAGEFIAHSQLRWAHDQGCPDHPAEPRGPVSAIALGRGTYKHKMADALSGLCRHHGREYHSNERTRPYEMGSTEEGFFLDLDNGSRGGQGVSSPVYVDYTKGAYITYWFFYGYNDGVASFNHEGDWERISIRLTITNRPTHVAYFQHNKYCVYEWSKVQKYKNNHPIVFSAEGSHASYTQTGSHWTGLWWDYTDKSGKKWQTWKSLLMVRDQPWYGYGGAWGEVGETSTTTGPLGPSPFKGPTPGNWRPGCH